MPSSADFRAYVQAERDYLRRLVDIYTGKDTDIGVPAEHLVVEHLEKLLSTSMPPALRSFYMSEYDEMRAAFRAAALIGLTRKDFYDHACIEASRASTLLQKKLSFQEEAGSVLVQAASSTLRKALEGLEAGFVDSKNQVVERLRSEAQGVGDETMSIAEMVRAYMTSNQRVSTRGVSTEPKG